MEELRGEVTSTTMWQKQLDESAWRVWHEKEHTCEEAMKTSEKETLTGAPLSLHLRDEFLSTSVFSPYTNFC